MTTLTQKHCKACEGGVSPLTKQQAEDMLYDLKGWEINSEGTEIKQTFAFKNYYHTIAFVNALAYIANIENHHPDLEVYYNKCVVKFTTHAINGLSENDFICAAKVDGLIAMRQ